MIASIIKLFGWVLSQSRLYIRNQYKKNPAIFLVIVAAKIILKVVMVVMLTSCDSEYSYSKYNDVDIKRWSYQDTLSYDIPADVDIKNTYIGIRYNDKYKYSNLWIKYITDGTTRRKNILLFNNKGEPLGKTLGANSTLIVALDSTLVGVNNIKIVQNMRLNPLPGINAVGVLIKK